MTDPNVKDLPPACSRSMQWAVSDLFSGFAVSEYGDVIRISDGRRIKGSINLDGYISYSLSASDGTRRHVLAHRLVAMCFIPCDDQEGKQVAHKNGSRLMNHFSNLRWSTSAQNHGDRRIHGTGPLGELNPNAKLTEVDVKKIRELYRSIKMRDLDMKVKDLAAMFGIHHATLCGIVRRKLWTTVE